MPDDRMFAQLMEEPQPPKAAQTPPPRRPKEPASDSLPDVLEDLGTVGYTQHTYRLTDAESRWLRRFTLRLSERLDKHIAQNTLLRVLFRLAEDEWRASPKQNRLIEELSNLKE